jgi:hypothetical protein
MIIENLLFLAHDIWVCALDCSRSSPAMKVFGRLIAPIQSVRDDLMGCTILAMCCIRMYDILDVS